MRSRQLPARVRLGAGLAAVVLSLGALAAGAQTAAGPAPTHPWQAAPSGGLLRPLMPDHALEPPADFVPVLITYGQGVQRYVCKTADKPAGSFAWTLKEPQAKLYDAADHEIGAHSAGPAWQLTDGSKAVKKKVLGTFPALELDGVPWLLVEIESSGAGLLAGTRYVQRVDTVGGAAPATGCDAAHAGASLDVEYRATYIFYAPRPRQ
jgi:hypothetical protein